MLAVPFQRLVTKELVMGITATALAWQSLLPTAVVLAVMVAPPLELAAQKPPPEGERLDPTFGTSGRVVSPFNEATGFLRALARQADGKLVATGTYAKNSSTNILLLRYRPDGSLDPAFGSNGVVVTDIANGSRDDTNTLALQADGKIVVGGTMNRTGDFDGDIDFLIARYDDTGSLDSSFGGGDGVFILDLGYGSEGVMSLALHADGKMVAAGYVNPGFDADAHFAVLRLLPDGSLDPAFGSGGVVITDFTPPGAGTFAADIGTAMQLQPDGKIVVAGNSFVGTAATQTFALARYATDGSLDPTFGVGGKVVHRFSQTFLYLHAIVLQRDGKIVASGVNVRNLISSWVITRYQPDGTPDAGFGRAGVILLPYQGRAQAIALQEDKGILVAGNASLRTGSSDFGLVRLTPAGAVDPAFGHGNAPVLTDFAGSFDTPRAIAIQPDGRIVLAGSATLDAGRSAPALARYVAGSPAH